MYCIIIVNNVNYIIYYYVYVTYTHTRRVVPNATHAAPGCLVDRVCTPPFAFVCVHTTRSRLVRTNSRRVSLLSVVRTRNDNNYRYTTYTKHFAEENHKPDELIRYESSCRRRRRRSDASYTVRIARRHFRASVRWKMLGGGMRAYLHQR